MPPPRGRRDDRQPPPRGACPPAGQPALEHTPTHHPTPEEQDPQPTTRLLRHQKRAPRDVGVKDLRPLRGRPTGRSLTPTPYPGAPNHRRRSDKRKIRTKNKGVDRPRSFRDDTLTLMAFRSMNILILTIAIFTDGRPSLLPTRRSRSLRSRPPSRPTNSHPTSRMITVGELGVALGRHRRAVTRLLVAATN